MPLLSCTSLQGGISDSFDPLRWKRPNRKHFGGFFRGDVEVEMCKEQSTDGAAGLANFSMLFEHTLPLKCIAW
jgi:hypothetical protein